MIQFLARRLLATVPLLFFVSVVVFSFVHVLPGDPAVLFLGEARELDAAFFVGVAIVLAAVFGHAWLQMRQRRLDDPERCVIVQSNCSVDRSGIDARRAAASPRC